MGRFTWPPRRRSCPQRLSLRPRRSPPLPCSSPTKLGIGSSEYSKGDQPAGRRTHRWPHWSTTKGGTSAGTALSQNKPTVTEALRYGESDTSKPEQPRKRPPLRGMLAIRAEQSRTCSYTLRQRGILSQHERDYTAQAKLRQYDAEPQRSRRVRWKPVRESTPAARGRARCPGCGLSLLHA
jgi:hypothetical protein